ncbi:MAG TPA: oxalate/formate MFS antiporter [Blastocatellia bacterium]|jgi:OFA family oxalate/formate antiporter-like MFS transporter|nr:oxalate/formate MFS antiporter [Blastocatellia bacterium]
METPSQGLPRHWKLIACMLAMMAVANVQYAWTKFTGPLMDSMHSNLDTIQWAFFFFVITQTWLLPVYGVLIERYGPRLLVSLGGILVALGWVGSGMATTLPALYVSYGAAGIGVGAVYGACIGLAIKWFPDRRGLCVGLVAGSYGFGTALTILPISHMIETSGYQHAFIVWGIIQGLVVLLAAQILSAPGKGWTPPDWEQKKARVQSKVQQSTRDYTPPEMLVTTSFYVMYLMMTIVAASGLMATAQLSPIAKSYKIDNYVLFSGITLLNFTLVTNGILNGGTRPLFGWISDQIGRYETMFIAFALEGLAIAGLGLVGSRPVWFVVMSGMIFFAWGEIYSLFPAAIADVFGSKHATTNFSFLYTSKGVASAFAGPAAAKLTQVSNGSWRPVFWVAAAGNLIAALLAIVWLKPLISRLLSRQSAPAISPAPVPLDTVPKTG